MMHSEDDYEIGQHYVVHVTHINNPHSFYIRLIKFDDILEDLEEPGEVIDKLEQNMQVVYRSQTCTKYVRGMITSINDCIGDKTCNIYAIDYGCSDVNVDHQDIKMPRDHKIVSPLAVHCELHLCAPKGAGFSEEAIKAMKFYVGKESALMKIKNKTIGKLSVQLKNSCPDDISTLLALTEYTCLSMSLPSISKLNTPSLPNFDYKYQETNVGDIFHVRVQSGTSLSAFFVAEVDEFKKFKSNEHKDFIQYCKSQPSTKMISVGDSVGALYQGDSFERAVVKQIVEPQCKALVQLMEWGIEEVVGINFIIPINKERFVQKPAVALYCSADESQVWDNRLHKFLYPGYEFKIKIIKPGYKFEVPNEVELIRI